MSDLIERKTALNLITAYKNNAHLQFSQTARNKKMKSYLEKCAYTEAVFNTWEDAEMLIFDIPAVSRWISCSESMMPDGKRVLVRLTNGEVFVMSRNGDVISDGLRHLTGLSGVEHWMPIPDAYEPPEIGVQGGCADNIEKNCENCARETCAVMPPSGKCYCDFWQAMTEPPESGCRTMTNSERIRQMTDEELAEMLAPLRMKCEICAVELRPLNCRFEDCKRNALAWLKQEAKDDD